MPRWAACTNAAGCGWTRCNTASPRNALPHGWHLAALHQRLHQDMRTALAPRQSHLDRLALRLAAQRPALRLVALAQATQRAGQRIDAALKQRLARDAARITALGRALHAVSPLATLQRGYAILLDEHGHSLRQISQLQPGQHVIARLADGERRLRVEGDDEPA